jgi:hypothetical protein
VWNAVSIVPVALEDLVITSLKCEKATVQHERIEMSKCILNLCNQLFCCRGKSFVPLIRLKGPEEAQVAYVGIWRVSGLGDEFKVPVVCCCCSHPVGIIRFVMRLCPILLDLYVGVRIVVVGPFGLDSRNYFVHHKFPIDILCYIHILCLHRLAGLLMDPRCDATCGVKGQMPIKPSQVMSP